MNGLTKRFFGKICFYLRSMYSVHFFFLNHILKLNLIRGLIVNVNLKTFSCSSNIFNTSNIHMFKNSVKLYELIGVNTMSSYFYWKDFFIQNTYLVSIFVDGSIGWLYRNLLAFCKDFKCCSTSVSYIKKCSYCFTWQSQKARIRYAVSGVVVGGGGCDVNNVLVCD